MVYVGEVQEWRDGRWRVVRLGQDVRVVDRRREPEQGGGWFADGGPARSRAAARR